MIKSKVEYRRAYLDVQLSQHFLTGKKEWTKQAHRMSNKI